MHKSIASTIVTIGAITAVVVGFGSAASAGDVAPATPAQLVDSLHQAFGTHHARAVHAKGILLEGEYRPDPGARALSSSPLFSGSAVPVVARFSDFTGLPDIPDAAAEANPRGFAIKFKETDGTSMDIVSHSFNGFPTANATDFGELMRAIGASGPTAPKPTPLDRFLSAHPVAKAFLTSQKPAPASYATLGYFGVNAFAFTNAAGQRRFVRYRFVPKAGEQLLDATTLAGKSPTYLIDEVGQRLARSPIVFEWYAQLAEADDPIEDPSAAWPEKRTLVKLGTLTLQRLVPDATAADKATMFLPNNVTAGIAPADPMITVRSQAYPISFAERQ